MAPARKHAHEHVAYHVIVASSRVMASFCPRETMLLICARAKQHYNSMKPNVQPDLYNDVQRAFVEVYTCVFLSLGRTASLHYGWL